MGTIYYAVNTKTKKAYELGKGAWFRLAPQDSRIADCSNYDHVLRVIRDSIITVDSGWTREAQDDFAYHEDIARSIVSLGDELEIRDDSSYDDPLGAYNEYGMDRPVPDIELIGSRYR